MGKRGPKKGDKNAGRPTAIDIEELRKFMELAPWTLEEVASNFDISEDAVIDNIKRYYNKTFPVYRNGRLVKTRSSLLRKALHRALVENSDKMLEHCLRELCGWGKDKADVVINNNLALTGPALDAKIDEYIKKRQRKQGS